jgi:ribonuclease-3
VGSTNTTSVRPHKQPGDCVPGRPLARAAWRRCGVIQDTKTAELSQLERRLGYTFENQELLLRALTHKSHSRQHNERLEFLGDAVLGYVIADTLYRDHPELAEDALTILRADLVRRETLGELGTTLGIGDFLRLGAGERKSGGKKRVSILADAVEAIIGAISLDGGLEAGRGVVLTIYGDLLKDVRARRIRAVKDAKTQLQEFLQGRSLPLPVYDVVETSGSDHRRIFTVACRVESLDQVTTGTGSSRRAAEKEAAEAMIGRIEDLE